MVRSLHWLRGPRPNARTFAPSGSSANDAVPAADIAPRSLRYTAPPPPSVPPLVNASHTAASRTASARALFTSLSSARGQSACAGQHVGTRAAQQKHTHSARRSATRTRTCPRCPPLRRARLPGVVHAPRGAHHQAPTLLHTRRWRCAAARMSPRPARAARPRHSRSRQACSRKVLGASAQGLCSIRGRAGKGEEPRALASTRKRAYSCAGALCLSVPSRERPAPEAPLRALQLGHRAPPRARRLVKPPSQTWRYHAGSRKEQRDGLCACL